MRNRTFPRWMGPLVGLWLGAYVSIREFLPGQPIEWEKVIFYSRTGMMGGIALWLADAPPAAERRAPSHGGELLAALGWVVIILPGVNVLVNLWSFLVNRRVAGWTNKWSRLAVAISLLLSVLCLIVWCAP